MAIFSIYTGFIYNEFFSIVTTTFGPSHFECATNGNITNPVRHQTPACHTQATPGQRTMQ